MEESFASPRVPAFIHVLISSFMSTTEAVCLVLNERNTSRGIELLLQCYRELYLYQNLGSLQDAKIRIILDKVRTFGLLLVRVPDSLHFSKSVAEHSLRLTCDAVLEIL